VECAVRAHPHLRFPYHVTSGAGNGGGTSCPGAWKIRGGDAPPSPVGVISK
jgi:hypothetical protein